MIATEIIKKKRNKKPLSFEDIEFFISGYTKGSIPDYQMSALLMAILLQGMSDEETANLTQVMLNSGVKLDFPEHLFPVDKHSTGGVGDKTSLVLAPIVAACDVPVPMMSGRGLGHTGGTLDKLESIPGFNVSLSLEDFKKMVSRINLSYIGQTNDICPADKKIYSLRDVTATVESLPLICASIMSKKIAEGIRGLILDVKVGSGAFMKTQESALDLAQGLISIGKAHNIQTKALITNMDQPLGRYCGNALEVHECLSILKRQDFSEYNYKDFSDTEYLSLELASEMISLAKNIDLADAKNLALKALESGKAFEKFAQVCKEQGGDLEKLPHPTEKFEIKIQKKGFLKSFNTEAIGVAGIQLGAGRTLVTDLINPVVGIEIHKKIGDLLTVGDRIFTIHTDKQKKGIEAARNNLNHCFEISEEPCLAPELLLQRL